MKERHCGPNQVPVPWGAEGKPLGRFEGTWRQRRRWLVSSSEMEPGTAGTLQQTGQPGAGRHSGAWGLGQKVLGWPWILSSHHICVLCVAECGAGGALRDCRTGWVLHPQCCTGDSISEETSWRGDCGWGTSASHLPFAGSCQPSDKSVGWAWEKPKQLGWPGGFISTSWQSSLMKRTECRCKEIRKHVANTAGVHTDT